MICAPKGAAGRQVSPGATETGSTPTRNLASGCREAPFRHEEGLARPVVDFGEEIRDGTAAFAIEDDASVDVAHG